MRFIFYLLLFYILFVLVRFVVKSLFGKKKEEFQDYKRPQGRFKDAEEVDFKEIKDDDKTGKE